MKKISVIFIFAVLFTLLLAVTVYADNLAIEAEDFDIKGYFNVKTDSTASDGKYIQATRNNASSSITSEKYFTEVEAEYKFSIATEASYVIYLRVADPTNTGSNDSCWVTVDGVLYQAHFGSSDPSFQWKKLVITKLNDGDHIIRLYNRESQARIDKIIITSNLLFIPTGMGELPENEFYDESDLPTPAPEKKPPANEHPRLLVRADDLPTIRENLNHPQNAEVYAKVQTLAASTRNGNQASYSEDLLEIMQAKAFMYLVNGDTQRGQEAVTIMLNHMRKFSLGTGAATCDTMRFCGHFIFTTACVYDWCYDLITPDERTEYIKKCEDLAARYFEGGYPIVQEAVPSGSQGHDDENPLFRDLLALGIAVYDEKPFIYNDIGGVLYSNYFIWRQDLYPSGWNHQGVSTYGIFRTYWEAICAYMLDVIDQNPFPNSLNEYVYKYLYFRRPDGTYVMDGDDAKVFLNKFSSNSNGLYFIIGNMYKDSAIKRQYYHDMPNGNRSTSYLTGISAPMYLLMNDVSVESKNDLSLPLTRYFGSPVGAMIARTDWDEGANANTAIAVMKPFENYFAGHMHRETGSFQLYYKGMLALDSGAYEAPAYTKDDGTTVNGSGWGTAHYTMYLSAPIAHNVMAVYDENNPSEESQAGQWAEPAGNSALGTFEEYKNGSHKTGEIIGYDFGPDKNAPEYSYIEGDLTAAYKSDRVADYSRSYMFLNLFDDKIPAALIVFDRVEAQKADYKKAFLLHSQEEPTVNGNTVTIRRTEGHANGRLTDTVLLPQNLKIGKVGGEGSEYLTGGKNYEIYRQPEGDESGTWRLEIESDERAKKEYFLNVMQVSDDDESITPLSVTSNEQNGFIGVFVSDRAVFMKKDKGTVSTDFSVTAQGNGEISYIITNLAEGKWTVKNSSGISIYTQDVASDNGVLRFRTNAGTYTVTYSAKEGIEPKSFSLKGDAVKREYPSVSVYFDNNYNGKAILNGEKVMVNLADIAVHSSSAYEIDGKTFTAYGSNGILSGEAEKTDAVVSGNEATLELAPVYFNNDIYISLNDLAKAYDFSYEYDELAYVLRLECEPKARLDANGVAVDSVGRFNDDGTEAAELSAGQTVTFKATLSRRFGIGESKLNATVYVGIYSGDKLVCLGTDVKEFEAYGASAEYEVKISIPQNAGSNLTPRIYLWRSDSLAPCALSEKSADVTAVRVGGVLLEDFSPEKLSYEVQLPDYISDTPYVVCYGSGIGITASAEYSDGKIFLTLTKFGKNTVYTIELKRTSL